MAEDKGGKVKEVVVTPNTTRNTAHTKEKNRQHSLKL